MESWTFINMGWKLYFASLVGNSTFTITDAILYVPVVTLSIEDNSKLTKLLSEGFKRSFYWNKYKVIPNKKYNQNNYKKEIYFMLVIKE